MSGKVDLGEVCIRAKPKVAFYTQGMFGTTLFGVAVTVNFPNGVQFTIADGQVGDQTGIIDGAIVVKVGTGPGESSWCETKARAGFAQAEPASGTITAYDDVGHGLRSRARTAGHRRAIVMNRRGRGPTGSRTCRTVAPNAAPYR